MQSVALAKSAALALGEPASMPVKSHLRNTALVKIENAAVDYGDKRVLHPTSLIVEEGEFLTILGPSGSGKTTILKLIGGFLPPSEGRICFNATDISSLPPEKRPFNTVFQDYALFPHMSVGENVAYSLRVKGVDRRSRALQSANALDLVGLRGYADRRTGQLSGGQQQRVALARAIVAKPSVILLDEPLSALDAALRHQMQQFLKSIQRKLGTTFVFVTHDQQEALAMSDRIVVMDAGRIVQIGTPGQIYNEPETPFVAKFIGRTNLISASLVDPARGEFSTAAGPVFVSRATGVSARSSVDLAVRPECVTIRRPGHTSSTEFTNSLKGVVNEVTFAGSHYSYVVRADGGEGVLFECSGKPEGNAVFAEGDQVEISFSPEDVRLVGKP